MRFRYNFAAVAAVVLAVCCGDALSEIFDPLFKVTSVVGDVKILKPGASVPEKALEAHAYPYGSRILVGKWDGKVKTPSPELNLSLSRDHKFKLAEGTDLTILDGPSGDVQKKVFDVASGKLKTFISVSTVKTGGAEDAAVEAGITAITVKTPLGECSRLTDRNEINVDYDGQNHTVLFATESGMMEVVGAQYKINGMRRNAAVEIFGNKDYTRITNVAGEFSGSIDKGIDALEVISFKLRCVVKIWRRYAEIGGKMAVSVMAAYPDGSISSYAYMQGEKAVVDSATVLLGKDPETVKTGEGTVGGATVSGTNELGGATVETPSATATEEKPAASAAGGIEGFNFDW